MKELIYKKTKGHLGQYEDWWYLRTKEDGSKTVIHEWSHTQVSGLNTNSGEETYTVENFLAGKHYQKAIDELNTMLNPLEWK